MFARWLIGIYLVVGFFILYVLVFKAVFSSCNVRDGVDMGIDELKLIKEDE